MRVIIGGKYQSKLDAASVSIKKSMSDPVPTCNISVKDDDSTLEVVPLSELLVIDDMVIPNPTINYALNPSIDPYTTTWHLDSPVTGITPSTVVGGGVKFTFSNAANGAFQQLYQYTLNGSVTPGQNYTMSFYAQATSPVNIDVTGNLFFLDAASNVLVNHQIPLTPAPTSLTRFSITATPPAQCTLALIIAAPQTTNATNSGSITFTQFQFEPAWIPTLTYPTPWCGPAQTNCVQLPMGFWIRQYRKFAGFALLPGYGDYHGNARTVSIQAVGYAWLAGTILANDTFSNKTDAFIFSALLNKYFVTQLAIAVPDGTALVNTSNIITGATLTSLVSNWDDLRTLFDTMASQSGFYWTFDDYWNAIYAPPGYLSMPIALICDNSSQPNMVTTFPAYNFHRQNDYTQPGSTILVIGAGTNVAEIIDPSTTAQNGITSGYFLPAGTSWMRKVNESTLNSVVDCTNRGMAELIQYDKSRGIYSLTANVELLAGESIQVTSVTDGLNITTLLIQDVTATWIGTDETLNDVWEYNATLGAVNRAVINVISRIFRTTNRNTSAPAISTTTLALIERIGIEDIASPPSAPPASTYASTILADAPLAWYRLGELTGTIADDSSGDQYNGTLNGGITLDQTGLLTHDSNPSMLFNGSTGYVSLPTTFIPTASTHAWSVECWCNPSVLPSSPNFSCMAVMGASVSHEKAALLVHNNSGTVNFVLSCFGADITSSTVVSTATTYYVVGTYDGTNTRLYVNGSLVAGPTAFSVTLVASYARIGAEKDGGGGDSDFFNGFIQDVAYYNYTLSSTQIAAHYAAR